MKTRMEDELGLCDLNRGGGSGIDSALTAADKCAFVCSFSLCVLNTDQLLECCVLSFWENNIYYNQKYLTVETTKHWVLSRFLFSLQMQNTVTMTKIVN